jgi:hypothetical protein
MLRRVGYLPTLLLTLGLIIGTAVAAPRMLSVGQYAIAGDEAKSDAFWSLFNTRGNYTQNFASVEEMAKKVHLVVRGRIVDVRPGQFMFWEPGDDPPAPLILAIVQVDDVLKGSPNMRTPGFIEVSLDTPWDGWEKDVRPSIPAHEHLFFLFNDDQQRVEGGFERQDPANSPYLYWRPNGDQAVLREIDGHIAVFDPVDGRFPAELDGSNAAEVEAAIRASAVAAD